MTSGLPMGTAMARGLGRELGRVGTEGNISMLQHQLAAEEAEQARQFQAAQGLAGMPGLYGQPASLEMQLLGLQQPYELAQYQAEQQRAMMQPQLEMQRQGMLSNFYNNLMGQEFQGYYMEPSGFSQYVAPPLNALMQGLGTALPFIIGG